MISSTSLSKKAWDSLKNKPLRKKVDLTCIKKFFEIQSAIFECTNKLRNPELESIVLLDTKEKIDKAIEWLQTARSAFIIGLKNTDKTKHLHQPDPRELKKTLTKIKACDTALAILISTQKH